jgi:hypothetical protein
MCHKHKVHGLNEAQKAARVQKYRQFFAWHAGEAFIFTDEKLFLVQPTEQPDFSVKRIQNVSRVMVWGAIPKKGK